MFCVFHTEQDLVLVQDEDLATARLCSTARAKSCCSRNQDLVFWKSEIFPKQCLHWRGPGGVGKSPLEGFTRQSPLPRSKILHCYISELAWPSTKHSKTCILKELLSESLIFTYQNRPDPQPRSTNYILKELLSNMIIFTMQHLKEVCFLRILTPQREPGYKEGFLIWKKCVFWEFWPPGGSLVTTKGFLIWKSFIFWEFWQPGGSLVTKKVFFVLKQICFLRILTPRREPVDTKKGF